MPNTNSSNSSNETLAQNIKHSGPDAHPNSKSKQPLPLQSKKSGNKIKQSLPARIAAMSLLIIFTVYFLLPLWWLIVSATKDKAGLISGAPLWFGEFNLIDNLQGALTYSDGVFMKWMLNSVIYAGVGALCATVIAGMCGYALAKYQFRGRELFFNIILGGVLVPATVLALPLFLIFSEFDASNTFWSVFLPSIVSPFGVYLSRIYAAESVPDEIIEAARLDGSGEVRTYFTVSFRLMTPALVTVFLFQFVSIWNNFFLPLIMLRDESLFPVTLGIYSWNSKIGQYPELQTYVIVASLISIIPLIISFLILQRFWQNGLGAGSVK